MIAENVADALVERVRGMIPAVEAVYLFGSRVSGRERQGSDLDVAVLLPPGDRLRLLDRLALAASLAEAAGTDVDLSVLDLGRGVVHAKEVVTSGVRVYAREPKVVGEFEMLTLSRYARLNEDRAPVLEAYRATSQPHG